MRLTLPFKIKVTASTTRTTMASKSIDPTTLAALRSLRDAIPKLHEKLRGSTDDRSGVLTDHQVNEWGIPIVAETTAPAAPSALSDEEPAYWEKIADLNEKGRVASLLLGGHRLFSVNISELLTADLLQSVTKLDLAGTDMPVDALCQIIRRAPGLLALYLGGNSLGDAGMEHIVKALPQSLQLLDVRYNDIGHSGAVVLADFLKRSQSCEKLYLEGNALGDAGAHALSDTGCVKELYLGQNNIGPAGACSLANGLTKPSTRLERLYLEGNHIGADGAISFQRALKTVGDKKKLKNLFVDNNSIGKTESMKLGQALSSSTMIGDSAC